MSVVQCWVGSLIKLCCQLEDVEILVADHVQKVVKSNFGAAWEEIGDENELEDTYALSSGSLQGLYAPVLVVL